MLSISRESLRYWLPLLVGLFVIAAAGFWLRRSIDPPFGRELYPRPDAVEYSEMARRFAYFEGFGLEVSDAVVPSRYPALFPLMLSPVARIAGGDAMRYATAMALLGSISIMLAGWLGTLAAGNRRAGLLLAALLAVSGSHIHASHVVMSDLLMLMLFQAAVILALLHRKYWWDGHRTPYSSIMTAGLLAGALVAVRTPGAVLAAGFGLFYLLLLFRLLKKSEDGRVNYSRLVAVAALLVVGAALPVAFELLSRKIQLGSALANPYAYYIPSFRPDSGFEPLSFDWITQTEDGTRQANWKYFSEMILGIDEAHQGIRLPWKGALTVAGLVVFLVMSFKRRNGAVLLILILGPASLLLLHMMYYWQEARLVLVPVFVSLFLVAYFLAGCSIGVERLLRRVLPAKAGEMAGIGLFSVAAAGLLYLQKEPVDSALNTEIPSRGFTGDLRRQLRERIEALPDGTIAPVVVTNAGTLMVKNLLFPGAASQSARVITLTDSYNNEGHVYRVIHQEPYGIPEGHVIEKPATVLAWQNPDNSGSGPLRFRDDVLEMLRQHAGKSHVLILLKAPDPETKRAFEEWQDRADWSLEELGRYNDFQLLEAKPVDDPALDPAQH